MLQKERQVVKNKYQTTVKRNFSLHRNMPCDVSLSLWFVYSERNAAARSGNLHACKYGDARQPFEKSQHTALLPGEGYEWDTTIMRVSRTPNLHTREIELDTARERERERKMRHTRAHQTPPRSRCIVNSPAKGSKAPRQNNNKTPAGFSRRTIYVTFFFPFCRTVEFLFNMKDESRTISNNLDVLWKNKLTMVEEYKSYVSKTRLVVPPPPPPPPSSSCLLFLLPFLRHRRRRRRRRHHRGRHRRLLLVR